MAIKVFIVDDSSVVRSVLTDLLNAAAGIKVIGSAIDPLFAETRMQQQWPDVIVLDIEMPRMDGLTYLKKIMATHPTPVVMCSTLTEKGSRASMRALQYGAIEVVAKPKAKLRTSLPEASGELIRCVRAAAQANMSRVRTAPITAPSPIAAKLCADAILSSSTSTSSRIRRDTLVAIGTSTGGTQALEQVLTRLPLGMPPIMVVQHMPEKFTSAFAERLDSISTLRVCEAVDGQKVLPDEVYVAPGGKHMLLEYSSGQAICRLKEGPPVSRHKPSVDVLFRSVANQNPKNALGIIMTGMGDDGAAGLLEMKTAGARTLGQNEESCVVYGMPAKAKERGAVALEVALDSIATHIVSFSRKG